MAVVFASALFFGEMFHGRGYSNVQGELFGGILVSIIFFLFIFKDSSIFSQIESSNLIEKCRMLSEIGTIIVMLIIRASFDIFALKELEKRSISVGTAGMIASLFLGYNSRNGTRLQSCRLLFHRDQPLNISSCHTH
ncbi:MAG: hypothetical protein U9N35_06715 [Euryarchaeota archaeon]|nr:hypothetical protein [Euryarchaeota archaeon]